MRKGGMIVTWNRMRSERRFLLEDKNLEEEDNE